MSYHGLRLGHFSEPMIIYNKYTHEFSFYLFGKYYVGRTSGILMAALSWYDDIERKYLTVGPSPSEGQHEEGGER